ncbi:MAG: division/cell wall cluster transcriptional repressor MraZ [Coriobacteriia bacterium]|nr:division/cell wall cluster transcriptional repressor MraZ [Coriobacteriia bacterium]
MIDLMGEYRHKVDAKGRLSLPAKFRKALSTESEAEAAAPVELVITIDPSDECLYVFEPEGFNEWVASFFEKDGGFDARSKKHTAVRRKLKSRAREVEVDGAGRINLSAGQRESVGIAKDVVLVGNTGYFEIWDAQKWDESYEDVDLESMLFD